MTLPKIGEATVSNITSHLAVNDCTVNVDLRPAAIMSQAFIMSTLSAFGSCSNATVLIIGCCLLRANFRRKNVLILILNLALVDFVISMLYQPFLVVSIIHHRWMRQELVLCRMVSALKYCLGSVSIMTIMLLALKNCLLVCQNTLHEKLFRVRYVCVMLVTMWCLCLLSVVPLIPAETRTVYDERYFLCHVERHKSGLWYPILSGLLFFIIPLVTIIICYAQIGLAFRRQSVRVDTQSVEALSPTEKAKRTRRIQDGRKIAMSVLIIIANFAICYLPTAVVLIFDNYCNALPHAFHRIAAIVINCPPVLNPIVYFARNRRIIDRMRHFWGHLKRRRPKSPVVPIL